MEYPEYPYSEVISYTENRDETITLMVNVVFPAVGDSKVYSHEVVVRPLEDGSVQYVSREKCMSHGIVLGHDVVINKGPDRDIDRDAVNMLITFLLDGEYQMIVVDKLTDLTSDLSDLEEFLNDAVAIGVSVFELSTMQIRHHVYMEGCPDYPTIGRIINLRS